MGTAALGRRIRAGVVLACAVGALLGVTAQAAAGTVTAASTTSGHGDHGDPFSFD